MFEKLPSLHGFHPDWYAGGPGASYLPLTYDLVVLTKPRSVVTLGFGEGQIHFAFCQAAREAGLTTRCTVLRRDFQENENAEEAWVRGLECGGECYGESSQLVSEPWTDFASSLTARRVDQVDILFIDEIDSGADLERLLSSYEPVLSRDGLVLFHGISLQRSDAPGTVWEKWTAGRHAVRFSAGLGLGVATVSPKTEPLLPRYDWLFPQERASALANLYRLAAERIEARELATKATREVASLKARQVWIDSLLADRKEAQRVVDDQARIIGDLQPRVEAWQRDREILHRDRVKAQLVMDTQLEQIKHWTAVAQRYETERNKYKQQATEQKQIIKIAKEACRKKGRCFQLPDEKAAKKQRPISERILREIKRVPANLLGRKAAAPPVAKTDSPKKARKAETKGPADARQRYAEWIAQHEPDETGLEAQRQASKQWPNPPAISLLVPVLNTPAKFLEEMIASVRAQTYPIWQLCLVDGGSTDAATLAVLEQERAAADPRIKLTRLPANLGIAENTNRALELTTGDFVACADHDDVLPPFALYELARAISGHPDADIFYSDEDRLSSTGQRHSPFFKPEWSPEYLLSSMYLGHLTAYRMDLVRRVGPFRAEFDLSQDYDFALRATEQAREVVHLPHVLYHWREHPASGSAGGKPEARKTNLAALAAAMERRGLAAEIMEYPTANRARLTIPDWPKVSVIIPTDSSERGKFLVEELPKMTSYRDYEVVIVTNSTLAAQLETVAPAQPVFRFVRYDEAFNFSAKCNLGAEVASGSRLIFFNDDVESAQPDWMENLIEPLENPAIGAVAPKLLYETGKIQHAGLVTGVRGLVGTACHQWDGNSTAHTNFAQSMRDVSALSGACLTMRRDDFFAVGEWDTTHVPIAHSDLDLCFKIRAAGMRCVYTPFVTMRHRGHASIGAQEPRVEAMRREKPSVFLLKRWPDYTCHDPYFPDNVRDWLYADSPTPIRMWAPDVRWTGGDRGDLLLVSHDLSWSGAPLILFQLAQWCQAHGYFVTVMSPVDGPVRQKFFEAGIPLIVDPLITTGHPSFVEFAREFDGVIASTIFGAPIVHAAKAAGVPHLWWIHEGRVAEDYLANDAKMRTALGLANLIVTPDTTSAQVYQPFTNRAIRVVNYGIFDPNEKLPPAKTRPASEVVQFLLLGTIEHRKGQQVFLDALRQLPADVRRRAHFQIIGRAHDLELAARLAAAAREFSCLSYEKSVPHEQALAAIRDADVMISASRDETGPLILMEALALGVAILSTTVGCVAENLAGDAAGIFFPPGNDRALAAGIAQLVREPERLQRLRGAARAAYEKYFTFDRFGQEFGKLIDEAIGVSNPGPRSANAT